MFTRCLHGDKDLCDFLTPEPRREPFPGLCIPAMRQDAEVAEIKRRSHSQDPFHRPLKLEKRRHADSQPEGTDTSMRPADFPFTYAQ